MYQPPNKKHWKGRANAEDGPDGHLWHHIIQLLDLSSELRTNHHKNITFLGFECEEGVRRNQGRLGAKDGSNSLRESLSKLAVHFEQDQLKIQDAGQVICKGSELENAQNRLAEKVKVLLDNNLFPVLLGGGHEIAYGHYEGVRRHLAGKGTIGIINLDAHFDFRSYESGPSSGTPFKQIFDENKQRGESFNYLPIGINRASNTRGLFKAIEQAQVNYLAVNDFDFSNNAALQTTIEKFADLVDHIYLTLDLDVLSAAYVPGVSAPAAYGLEPQVVKKCILDVYNTGKLISMDIAELNPTYDIDNRSSKLAAYFVYELAMNTLTH